jgi:hypothetical protein
MLDGIRERASSQRFAERVDRPTKEAGLLPGAHDDTAFVRHARYALGRASRRLQRPVQLSQPCPRLMCSSHFLEIRPPSGLSMRARAVPLWERSRLRVA